MAFKQKPGSPVVVADDVGCTVWDETSGKTVDVKVSREALEDWAHPRGFRGTVDEMFALALPDVLLTVDRLTNGLKDPVPRHILVRTSDLNR
jgi:hypothetical protein